MDKIANSNDDIISVTSSDSESREGSVPMSTSGTFSSTSRRTKKRKHTSWVRQYFKDAPGSNRVMCIASRSCSVTYSVNSATSNLCLHLK